MSGYLYEDFDVNTAGTKESRKAVKRHELKLANGKPLSICRVCGVVFPDRPNTYAEQPYWWLECEEHRPADIAGSDSATRSGDLS